MTILLQQLVLVNGIMEAFVVHVIDDLGGSFEALSETQVKDAAECG